VLQLQHPAVLWIAGCFLFLSVMLIGIFNMIIQKPNSFRFKRKDVFVVDENSIEMFLDICNQTGVQITP